MTPFDYLREFKNITSETEALVRKKTGYIKDSELMQIFENGITGKYGKVYTLDPQTLIGWVNQFNNSKTKADNYLNSGLLNPETKVTDINYPQTSDDWKKETNKAFAAYLNGVTNFHHDIYNHLVCDSKITIGYLKKYTPAEYPHCDNVKIKAAMKQAVIDYFGRCRNNGWNQIYFIR